MFRVYDTEKKKWIVEDIYLNRHGELFLIKKRLFGLIKTFNALSPERYIYHKEISLLDKNNVYVYEGDYIKARVAEDKSVIGLVVFATELSSYIILCVDSDEFYTLGSDVSEDIEIIGNVFDDYKDK